MKFLILLIALITTNLVFCQTYTNQTKMIEYLGTTRYNSLAQNNAGYLRYIDARYSHGFSLIDYVDEKMNSFPVLSSLIKKNQDKTTTIISIDQFLSEITNGTVNYLMYSLKGDQKEHKHYVLGNSGKVLVVHSTEYVTNQLNNSN